LLQGLPSRIRWVIRNWHGKCVELLEENRIRVVTVKKPRLHFKVVIIDDEILYIGSNNPLSVVTVDLLVEKSINSGQQPGET